MSHTLLIIRREFNERVRKKSFILTTLLTPVLMLGLMVAPALIMEFARGERKTLAVVDDSGLVAPHLRSDDELLFEPTDLTAEEARALDDRFGVLYIGSDVLEHPDRVRLYTRGSLSVVLEHGITAQIEQILETEKLKAYDIENLPEILEAVQTEVRMQVFRDDRAQEEQQARSSAVAAGLGYLLGFVLYMFLMIYGAAVMQSVIEEKSSRVLEVMVSSVRPFELMLGKILGVAAVAAVQVLLWGVLICGAGALVLPRLMPDDVLAGAQALQQGLPQEAAAAADLDPELLQAVATATDAGYVVGLFVCLLLFVVGGYLLYSAMFAAVGSAVDNAQDAGQLQLPIVLPILAALLALTVVIKDPDSQLAFWLSIVPLTSPVVMMARIPYDIPAWEIALSLVVLYASFAAAVWCAAKIYRVGIFMYGKKPTLRELLKWMRYKY